MDLPRNPLADLYLGLQKYRAERAYVLDYVKKEFAGHVPDLWQLDLEWLATELTRLSYNGGLPGIRASFMAFSRLGNGSCVTRDAVKKLSPRVFLEKFKDYLRRTYGSWHLERHPNLCGATSYSAGENSKGASPERRNEVAAYLGQVEGTSAQDPKTGAACFGR